MLYILCAYDANIFNTPDFLDFLNWRCRERKSKQLDNIHTLVEPKEMLSTKDAWTNTATENDKQCKEDFCASCWRGGGGRSEKSTHSKRHDSKLSVLSDDQLHQQSEIQRLKNLLQSMQYTQFAEYRKTYSLLSLHEAAVFNSCSVLNRLALGYVLDHIRRVFKRPDVCTAQLDDTWSQEAIFSHLETCKRVGKRWSYLKDSVQVRPGREGQESFRKLYCKITALPLCPHLSHQYQINIPDQIAPNLLRMLYKVYLALGYHAVRAVSAENVLRELTYEDIAAPTSSAASNAPLKDDGGELTITHQKRKEITSPVSTHPAKTRRKSKN